MFAECLAPTSEISGITLEFTFEHYVHISTVVEPTEFVMLKNKLKILL